MSFNSLSTTLANPVFRRPTAIPFFLPRYKVGGLSSSDVSMPNPRNEDDDAAKETLMERRGKGRKEFLFFPSLLFNFLVWEFDDDCIRIKKELIIIHHAFVEELLNIVDSGN